MLWGKLLYPVFFFCEESLVHCINLHYTDCSKMHSGSCSQVTSSRKCAIALCTSVSVLVLTFLSVLDEVWSRPVNPICSSPPTLIAGFDLLVTMCTGCVQNMQYLSDVLCSMYYSGNVNVLPEWVTWWGLIVGSAIKLSDQVLHTVLCNLWS